MIISQKPQSANYAEDGELINCVVIDKVTSDEPDNAAVTPMATRATTSRLRVIADRWHCARKATRSGMSSGRPAGG